MNSFKKDKKQISSQNNSLGFVDFLTANVQHRRVVLNDVGDRRDFAQRAIALRQAVLGLGRATIVKLQVVHAVRRAARLRTQRT